MKAGAHIPAAAAAAALLRRSHTLKLAKAEEASTERLISSFSLPSITKFQHGQKSVSVCEEVSQ